jgi:hypothetical protein
MKKRNATNTGWDSLLPTTAAENVLIDGTKSVDTHITDSMKSMLSVKFFGAVCDSVTSDQTAVQATIDYANTNGIKNVYIPYNTVYNKLTLTIPSGVRLIDESVENAIIDENALKTNNTTKLYRHAKYTGGTPGWVNAAQYVVTDVEDGATTFEWGITSVLNNYATAGENVAIYGQGNKYGKGPTWAGVFELRDRATLDNNVGNMRGLEIDVFSNNPLAVGQDKIGVDIIYGRNDDAGADTTISAGIRIIPKYGSSASKCSNGIVLSGIMDTAIACDASLYRYIGLFGTSIYGFDTSGGNVQVPLKMKENTSISFDSQDKAQMKYNPDTQSFEFWYSGSRVGSIKCVGGVDHEL